MEGNPGPKYMHYAFIKLYVTYNKDPVLEAALWARNRVGTKQEPGVDERGDFLFIYFVYTLFNTASFAALSFHCVGGC
jgi:hypothetical protein